MRQHWYWKPYLLADMSAKQAMGVNATQIFVAQMPPPVEGTDIHVTLRIGGNRSQEVDRAIQNLLFAIRRLQEIC
jgi:hypothetical protein